MTEVWIIVTALITEGDFNVIGYESLHADNVQCEQALHNFAKTKLANVVHREIGQLVSIEDDGWDYYFQCVGVDLKKVQ